MIDVALIHTRTKVTRSGINVFGQGKERCNLSLIEVKLKVTCAR